jgi:predicted metal-dependent hydrolase
MDHSSDFWGVVEDYLPDYKQRRKLLKDYGEKINLIYGV